MLAESTAEAAGVEPGDVLLEVEGHAAARLRVEELGALLRGPAGSAARVVVLKQQRQQQRQQTEGDSPPRLSSPAVLFFPPSSTVSRPAFPLMLRVKAAATAAITKAATPSPPKMLTLDLERKPIPQPPVKTAPLSSPKGRSIAYIRLHYFARDATRALAGALLNAEARGDEGLVLDLRNNPGGVFEEAVADAAMFLKRGATIASTTRTPLSSGSPSSPPSAPPPPVATFIAGDSDNDASPSSLRRAALSSAPMVVLVDAGSASGAEVLAGALADNGRAVLVGPRRTFGKGLIQYYFLVDDEGSRAGKKNRSGDGGVAGGIKVTGERESLMRDSLLMRESLTRPFPPLFFRFFFHLNPHVFFLTLSLHQKRNQPNHLQSPATPHQRAMTPRPSGDSSRSAGVRATAAARRAAARGLPLLLLRQRRRRLRPRRALPIPLLRSRTGA